MMWAKKIAAGVLAAALSLTLLTGCSGGGRSGSVISEGETISFDTSASYRLVQYTGNIYLTYELECTNEKDGTKIYAGQANKARCFAGTHEAITMDVKALSHNPNITGTDADGNVIQPGLYTVNYKTKTYKEGGTFGSVEKCWPLRPSAIMRRRPGPCRRCVQPPAPKTSRSIMSSC